MLTLDIVRFFEVGWKFLMRHRVVGPNLGVKLEKVTDVGSATHRSLFPRTPKELGIGINYFCS
jgi:hypothetical protein